MKVDNAACELAFGDASTRNQVCRDIIDYVVAAGDIPAWEGCKFLRTEQCGHSEMVSVNACLNRGRGLYEVRIAPMLHFQPVSHIYELDIRPNKQESQVIRTEYAVYRGCATASQIRNIEFLLRSVRDSILPGLSKFTLHYDPMASAGKLSDLPALATIGGIVKQLKSSTLPQPSAILANNALMNRLSMRASEDDWEGFIGLDTFFSDISHLGVSADELVNAISYLIKAKLLETLKIQTCRYYRYIGERQKFTVLSWPAYMLLTELGARVRPANPDDGVPAYVYTHEIAPLLHELRLKGALIDGGRQAVITQGTYVSRPTLHPLAYSGVHYAYDRTIDDFYAFLESIHPDLGNFSLEFSNLENQRQEVIAARASIAQLKGELVREENDLLVKEARMKEMERQLGF